MLHDRGIANYQTRHLFDENLIRSECFSVLFESLIRCLQSLSLYTLDIYIGDIATIQPSGLSFLIKHPIRQLPI